VLRRRLFSKTSREEIPRTIGATGATGASGASGVAWVAWVAVVATQPIVAVIPE